MSEFKVGKINKKIIHSDILNRDVTLSVYIPEDYTNLFKYQLIFCFDGFMLLCLYAYTFIYIYIYIYMYICIYIYVTNF